MLRRTIQFGLILVAAMAGESQLLPLVLAQESSDTFEESEVLSPDQWQEVDESIQRGLSWLASKQQRDGSFPAPMEGQPAITALCALAFMANGHSASEGPYSETLQRAVDYIIERQQANGLICLIAPRGAKLSRNVSHSIGRTVVYNHAIASLVLSEAYGQHNPEDSKEIHQAIELALDATLQMQRWKKELKFEQGGWRYLDKFEPMDSDLSLTGWQLMFLRSAKNAGFEVESEPIEQAVEYVKRCFSEQHKSFSYLATSNRHVTRAMAGAGILAFAHAGYHNSREAQLAGDWVLDHSFEEYGQLLHGIAQKGHHDRYHYGLLLCSQGMYQMGGRHWQQYFPAVSQAVVLAQQPSGAWHPLPRDVDKRYGNCYCTSLCVLSLSAPNQLLPIFQR